MLRWVSALVGVAFILSACSGDQNPPFRRSATTQHPKVVSVDDIVALAEAQGWTCVANGRGRMTSEARDAIADLPNDTADDRAAIALYERIPLGAEMSMTLCGSGDVASLPDPRVPDPSVPAETRMVIVAIGGDEATDEVLGVRASERSPIREELSATGVQVIFATIGEPQAR